MLGSDKVSCLVKYNKRYFARADGNVSLTWRAAEEAVRVSADLTSAAIIGGGGRGLTARLRSSAHVTGRKVCGVGRVALRNREKQRERKKTE